MSLGENIKNKREELKLSQEYIAEQLGISRQAISKWETDKSDPTASNLVELANLFEINLSELVDPQKYAEEQASNEKKRHEKKPNLILRANLTKWAIIFQAAFLHSSAMLIHKLPAHPDDKVYTGFVIFDLIILLACSIWMVSNHQFESDKQQRRKNVSIELCYCILLTLAGLLDIRFGLGLLGAVIIIAIALVYILYINPKFMYRKLTK